MESFMVKHSETPKYKHVPAAFINNIYEEGSKTEAVAYLQETWNELCHVKAELTLVTERLAAAERERDQYMILSKMRPKPYADTDAGLVTQIDELNAALEAKERQTIERCANLAEGWDYPLLARDIRSLAPAQEQPVAQPIPNRIPEILWREIESSLRLIGSHLSVVHKLDIPAIDALLKKMRDARIIPEGVAPAVPQGETHDV